MAPIGLQLSTLRDDAVRDLPGTLSRVGGLGYEGVELFHLEGVDAAELRHLLDVNGLAVAGHHASLADVEDRLDELAADLGTLGTSRLTLAWIDPLENAADADVMVDRLVECGRRARERGLTFGFHNHWGELKPLDDGRTFVDRLLEVPAELVELELDLGWIWDAGADPEALLAQAAGRCPLVHVKDFSSRGNRAFAPVGDGLVGYERVVPAAVRAGVEWLLVEQDETDGPAFDAVERSLAAVRRFAS